MTGPISSLLAIKALERALADVDSCPEPYAALSRPMIEYFLGVMKKASRMNITDKNWIEFYRVIGPVIDHYDKSGTGWRDGL